MPNLGGEEEKEAVTIKVPSEDAAPKSPSKKSGKKSTASKEGAEDDGLVRSLLRDCLGGGGTCARRVTRFEYTSFLPCVNTPLTSTPPPPHTRPTLTYYQSDEDRLLKENLELCVERAQDSDDAIAAAALETMAKTIRESTSTMTSVPKPLKFLRPHYDTLVALHATIFAAGKATAPAAADILSVLAMTMAEEGLNMSLRYRLAGVSPDIGSWGHEYVRNMAGEIGQMYAEITTGEEEEGEGNAATAALPSPTIAKLEVSDFIFHFSV